MTTVQGKYLKNRLKKPTLEQQKDVKLAFKVLCGYEPLESINHIYKLKDTELLTKSNN